MTYRELTEALARLSTDPRIHPNTRVNIAYQFDASLLGEPADIVSEQEELMSICLNGALVLSATRERNAVAR